AEEAGSFVEIDRTNEPRPADDRGRAIDVHRPDRLGRGNAGVRRTFSIPVIAAASASGPAGLCNFANNSAKHHRLLPRSFARRYLKSCTAAAFPPFTAR